MMILTGYQNGRSVLLVHQPVGLVQEGAEVEAVVTEEEVVVAALRQLLLW